jgi:hypothetical protein
MKRTLYFLQFLSLLTLYPWYLAAQTSLLALNSATDPASQTEAYLFVGMVLSYPVIVLACIWISWKWWRKGNKKSPFVPSALPLFITLLALAFINLVK